MADILVDRRDVQFVLFDLLNVQALAGTERFRHLDRDSLQMLLEEAQRFSEQRLFPLNIQGDKTGAVYDGGQVRAIPGMREAWQEFVEGGWLTMSEAPDLGGRAPQDHRFEAVFMIQMAVHGGDREIVVIVKRLRQPLRELALVVLEYVDERCHAFALFEDFVGDAR